jgi:hypothetical protein
MGIRLACPNGHKLHVKAFLAGKRGICPKCGATFIIPSPTDPQAADSQVPSASSSQVPSASGPAVARPEPLAPQPPQPGPESATGGDDPRPASEVKPRAAQPAPPAAAAEPTVTSAEAPHVDVAPPDDSTIPTPPSSWNLDRAARLRYLINRRRQRRSLVVVTIWLLATVLLLAGLLVWVLTRNAAQTSAQLDGPRTHLAQTFSPPYVARAGNRLLWEASPRPIAG